MNFQEVTLPKMPSRYAVEVVSPHGWIVRLQNSSEIQNLSQLLQAQGQGQSGGACGR
jgi:hypothetical protein